MRSMRQWGRRRDLPLASPSQTSRRDQNHPLPNTGMSDPKKKPGVTFWTTVVVVAILVAYPLSFGPACWITSRCECGTPLVTTVYRPVLRLWLASPGGLGGAVHWYACALARDSWDLRYSPDD